MGKIGLYLIISGMLVASITICMWIFSSPENQKWNNEELVDVPRLNFRPLPDNKESTLIWLQMSDKTNHEKWTKNLMAFLDKYYIHRKIEGGDNIVSCLNRTSAPEGKFCDVNIREWGPCIRENYFGYQKGAPCVFLKMNMLNGWMPEYYNDPNDLPELMPEELKNHIRNNVTRSEMDNIWISCEGENPVDVELMGPVQFYPSTQGLPGYYFPYKKTEGYLSPLVAVQFQRPTSGVIINIECKAWAKNIKHNREDGSGVVHFELLVD